MSASTILTIWLHPDHEEEALYHIGEETLTEGGIPFTVTHQPEERVTLDIAPPFTVIHRQKQITFVLGEPLTPGQIEEIAHEVTLGAIFGFMVKGEISLSSESTFNNLERFPSFEKTMKDQQPLSF